MLKALVLVAAVFAAACGSKEMEQCKDANAKLSVRISACGQECDRGHGEGCGIQTKIATPACFEKKDAETCRWMCLYAKDGKDLYCDQFKAITGKGVDDI